MSDFIPRPVNTVKEFLVWCKRAIAFVESLPDRNEASNEVTNSHNNKELYLVAEWLHGRAAQFATSRLAEPCTLPGQPRHFDKADVLRLLHSMTGSPGPDPEPTPEQRLSYVIRSATELYEAMRPRYTAEDQRRNQHSAGIWIKQLDINLRHLWYGVRRFPGSPRARRALNDLQSCCDYFIGPKTSESPHPQTMWRLLGKAARQLEREVSSGIDLQIGPGRHQGNGAAEGGTRGNTRHEDGVLVIANPNDPRDKFIYEHMAKGKTRAWIRNRVSARKPWERLESDQGVSDAARRYAVRHNLPWPIHRTFS
jgi:hypothetical protein